MINTFLYAQLSKIIISFIIAHIFAAAAAEQVLDCELASSQQNISLDIIC